MFGATRRLLGCGTCVLLGFFAASAVAAPGITPLPQETAVAKKEPALTQDPGLMERKTKAQGYLKEAFAVGYLSGRDLVEIRKGLDSQKGQKQLELLEMVESLADLQKRIVDQFLIWWSDNRGNYIELPRQPLPTAVSTATTSKPAAGYGLWTGPTAFKLADMGGEKNPSVSVNNIMFIQTTRMEGRLIPPSWRVVYKDPTATWGSFEVKFRDGKVESAGKPATVLELWGKRQALPRERLNVDSDQALFIATTNMPPELKLRSSSFDLDTRSGAPVWTIKLWVSRLRQPREEAELGEIIISTDDGAVLKNDLRPERVQ